MRISPAVQIDEQPVRYGDKRHEREHGTCVRVCVCVRYKVFQMFKCLILMKIERVLVIDFTMIHC